MKWNIHTLTILWLGLREWHMALQYYIMVYVDWVLEFYSTGYIDYETY